MQATHSHHRPTHEDHAHHTANTEPQPQHPDHTEHMAHSGHSHHEAHADHTNQPEHMTHVNHDAHKGHAGHAAHTDHTGHETMFRNRFWVSLLLTVPVVLFSPMIQEWLGFSMPEFTGDELIAPLFSLVIFFYGGIPFLGMARPEIQNRQPGMMLLISMAITVAFAYSLAAVFFDPESGFFWEMATLIDIMLLGHWLEMRSIRQASGALRELAKLMPDTAERLNTDGSTSTISTTELKTGDLVLVRPGASIPADGVVEDGQSEVNEAMITGESRPIHKHTGEKVITGTINGDGSLRIRVMATGDQTALAGIMRLVEQAQQSKSRTQVLADKAAGWLFYVALSVAILTAIAWVIAEGFNVEVLERVVTVLVVSCPHALGLAIPLVVAISTSLAAGNGVLVRDRLALESARELDVIIFDKTGTLTKGEQGVVAIQTAEAWQEHDALALAAAVEGDSEHMTARAVREKAQSLNLALPAISEFSALKGRGVQADWNGQAVYVGGPRLLELLNLTPTNQLASFTDDAGSKGQTVIYLVVEQQIVAGFALADVIRPESKAAVQRLHELGIEVAMLTGDSRAVAQAVADELGIDRVFAEVLPEHKDHKVAELQHMGKRVAMVGDGVNDAPALTRADIGIAIGSGTDVAVESADIILARSNPLDVVKIMELSRASYRKMIQNLLWAAGYNVVVLPLAAGVLAPIGILLSPAVGAVFMSLSTVIVALNAQLLRGLKFTA
ncbi:MAG: heavy metal translocating P-type ATPase [Chloroflexi bacterium]|nr:heavy metal translocating P-type ATPase [Chloroflexota bacterium]NOG66046.1 heavy metal translocating P-type ATPase [Chloroflexota bacterium]